MSRYKEIPEGYTEEQIEEKLPFLKNVDFEDVVIEINKNNKPYWSKGRFYNGTFINSYWYYGDFYNGIFKNSYWRNGYFFNETFINSYWYYGGFQNGIFKNSYWRNGFIYNGYFINSIIKKIDIYNRSKDYSKAKFYNCIILEPKLLKSDRAYSKLTFKGIE